MSTHESKRTDLQKEYEEYLREEAGFRHFEGNAEFSANNREDELQREYEEYLKSELDGANPKKSPKVGRISFLKKSILAIFALTFLIFIAYFVFIFSKIHSFTRNINISNNNPSVISDLKSTAFSLIPSQRKRLVGENNGRINILLLGAAGDQNVGKNLTDTIMVASINTAKNKISLLSLPRDMYVKIPRTNSFTKLNGLYQYGLRNEIGSDAIIESVKSITGLEIGYYLVVDFDGFVKFIDTLEGININVERDIYDERYPGPNYSYQTFELKKGYKELDGETALKYVRERHDDPQGDFGRAKRQQQVMQSVKNKVFSIKTILNPLKINELLSQLEKNIKTNLSLEDIESLIALSKELDTQNISTKVVDAWKKDSLLKVSHVSFNETRAFILVPRAGNYSQIQDLAENIFEIEKIEKRKSEIAKENASVLILNSSRDNYLAKKIKELLSENMGIKNISLSNQPTSSENQTTEVLDFTEKTKIFTLDEIIKSVPAKLSEKQNRKDFKNYDFVLVLGKDIINPYRFDEDDVEQFKNAQDNQEYFEVSE